MADLLKPAACPCCILIGTGTTVDGRALVDRADLPRLIEELQQEAKRA